MIKNVVTLITDFGLEDSYVASMKGVILNINLNVNIVDISHLVPSQDIFNAAIKIFSSYKYFPKGTIHLGIVDPGIGTKRRIIAVKTKDYIFIAPDNGLLSFILENEKELTVREIRKNSYFIGRGNNVFSGRDIFASVAAHLSVGNIFSSLGPKIDDPKILKIPRIKKNRNRILGSIIYIDKFGNLVTNIKIGDIPKPKDSIYEINKKRINGIVNSYENVKPKKLLAINGCMGYIEISARNSSAKRQLKVKVGETVKVIL